MSVASVGIKLTLDGAAQAEAGLRRVQGGMAALGNTAESVRGAMQQLAGAFAGVVSVRAFVQAADAVTQLQNQLRLATGSTQAATAAYQQLFEIAQRSRVSFTELGGTFASIARASESLGLSQQQLLRLTETIGNAITVGGQSAAAAQAALTQLSQGLASGVLRGEELNSILEQAPRLARALADGLGVSTGALRKLGEEGELTAERVIGALQSQASVLSSEVTSSVVTVGQAFTQLQNSATVLVGEIDRVSGASTTLAGVAQSASESLDNIARAFRDTQSAGQQVNVFADAIAVVFETVAVLGVNVAYVIKQIGTEIGGLAAQAAAVARLDFSAAREIGRLMREDAAAARREVDALSERILNQRRLAEQARQSLQGVDTRAEDARLAHYARQAEGVRKVGAAAADTKKKVKDLGDEFAAQREAARAWADAYQDFTRIAAQATAESLGLTKAQARLVEFLGSPAYANASEPMRQLALQQAYAAVTAEQNAAAQEQQAKALEAAAKAEFERIEALERSAASAEEQLQRLLDGERALVIAAERNITLAQAIEEVAIARLREQQAALMAEGDRDAEVLAIQREIDARKKLAEAIGRKEARDAAAESAREAAREWQRTAENIERSLTDALMRGFESGKDFARNLRDTVVNMFKTLVLRPVIQAVIAPMAGSLTGMLGLPGTANAGQLGNSMGIASGIKSVYDTIVGGFTSLGNSVAFAAQDIGAWLVNNTTGVLNRFGGSLMSNAGTLGTVGSYLGGAGAGWALGNLISGGYSAIGKSGNTANVIGTGVGAFFGGPIGAAIGGAVGGLVNRAFGRKLKDQGIQGTFTGDGFTGENFQFYKGGWFRSDKTKTSPLDPGLDKALDQQFMAIKTTALGLGEVLGVAGTALDGFTSSIKISFEGLNEQQIQEKLNEVFNGLGESMAQSILGASAVAGDAFIKEGETAQQALVRLAGSLEAVNAAFDTLAHTMLEASLQSADLASKLIEAFGGVEQFAAATNSYYQNFYTDAERLDTATRQLREAFADIGLTMPATKEAFRALVEAQDLTTESGRKTYAALLQLSGAFAQVTDATQAMKQAAEQAAQAAAEAAREQAQRAVDAATDAAQSALSGLRDAVAAEQDRLRERFERESDILNDRISAISDVIATLDNAIRSVRGSVETTSIASQTAARLTLQSVLTAVRGGADITGFEPVIAQASETLTRNDPNLYASREQFVRAQAQSADLLDQLNKAGGRQLTAAELQLKALEDGFEAELVRLDDLIANAQQQLDALLGIDSSVKPIPDALDDFAQAIADLSGSIQSLIPAILSALKAGALTPQQALEQLRGVGANLQTDAFNRIDGQNVYVSSGGAVGLQTTPGQVDIFGVDGSRFTGAEAVSFVNDALARNEAASVYAAAVEKGISSTALDELMGWASGTSSGWAAAQGLPRFARGGNYQGGLALVGEEGPELINFENPGQVYTAPQTQRLLDNREVVAELKALRSEVIELRAQSRRTADAVNGNPEAPMLVETVA